MRELNNLSWILIFTTTLLLVDFASAQVIPPKARGTRSSGPTIDQVTQPTAKSTSSGGPTIE